MNAQSRQEYDYKKFENHEEAQDKILNRVETDVLSLNQLRIVTRQDLVLNKILEEKWK